MANDNYYIGANDEHGVNPPTLGKRTPVLPGLNRQIYENEFNRSAKNKFIEACMRNSFSVFDVKPELQDISLSERVRRVNRQNLTLLVTFAYNASGDGTSFNNVSGVETFYSVTNPKARQSQVLATSIYNNLVQGTEQNGRGVKNLDASMLSNVNCTAALIEAGFMTNLREARLMINPLFQTEVGEESCLGVCDFLNTTFIARNDLNNYPVLRNGAKGNFVYLLQFILKNLGYNIAVDGIFGRNTENAVRNFQSTNSITSDGIVGSTTWKYLLTLPDYPVLRQGARGNYVRFLQALLESQLIPVGTIDGIFGAKTKTSVETFQRYNNLTVDGIVGKNTWALLTQMF